MTPDPRHRPKRVTVVLLSLLPLPAAWVGLDRLHSLLWTFVLYHGLCLTPAIAFWRHLWLPSLRTPTSGQLRAVTIGFGVLVPAALIAYGRIGAHVLDPGRLTAVLASRGFTGQMLVPLIVYFLVVNAVLEELFWRGVVLNALSEHSGRACAMGARWAAVAFAVWHVVPVGMLLRPGWAAAAVGGIFCAGVFLIGLYRRTGSLAAAILWHGLVFDLSFLLVLAVIVR